MGVRSLGNALASFGYKFGTTGLEAASAPPPPSIQASGGTKTTSGIYTIHTFTSPGNFIVTNAGGPAQVEYLIVGGWWWRWCGDAPPDADVEGGGGGSWCCLLNGSSNPSTTKKIPNNSHGSDLSYRYWKWWYRCPWHLINGAALGGNGGVSSALGVTVGGGGGGGSRNAGYPHPNPIPSHNNAGVPGPVASGPAPTDNAGSGGGGGQADDNYGPPGESTGGPLGKAGGAGHLILCNRWWWRWWIHC